MELNDIIGGLKAARAGLDSFDTVVTLATRLRDGLSSAKANKSIDSLRNMAVDAYMAAAETQVAKAELMKRLHQLEEAVMELDRFEKQAARYELAPTKAGAAVYKLKPDDDTGEPAHCICPACYDERRRSILQPRGRLLECHRCKATFEDGPAPSGSFRVGPGRWGR